MVQNNLVSFSSLYVVVFLSWSYYQAVIYDMVIKSEISSLSVGLRVPLWRLNYSNLLESQTQITLSAVIAD